MALNIITVDLTETISLDFLTVVCVWFLTEMTDSVSFSSLTAVLTEFRRLPVERQKNWMALEAFHVEASQKSCLNVARHHVEMT